MIQIIFIVTTVCKGLVMSNGCELSTVFLAVPNYFLDKIKRLEI